MDPVVGTYHFKWSPGSTATEQNSQVTDGHYAVLLFQCGQLDTKSPRSDVEMEMASSLTSIVAIVRVFKVSCAWCPPTDAHPFPDDKYSYSYI